MPKIQIGVNTHRALKVMAALNPSVTMEEIANEILAAGIPNHICDMIARWENHKVETIDLPKNLILVNEHVCDDVEKEQCTNTYGTEEPEPITADDREITLQLLKKLKEMLLVNGKVSNRELVRDFPNISKSGLYLHKYNIVQNKSKFYTKESLDKIDEAIKELEGTTEEII